MLLDIIVFFIVVVFDCFLFGDYVDVEDWYVLEVFCFKLNLLLVFMNMVNSIIGVGIIG